MSCANKNAEQFQDIQIKIKKKNLGKERNL